MERAIGPVMKRDSISDLATLAIDHGARSRTVRQAVRMLIYVESRTQRATEIR